MRKTLVALSALIAASASFPFNIRTTDHAIATGKPRKPREKSSWARTRAEVEQDMAIQAWNEQVETKRQAKLARKARR
jgi:hypothetical protein